MRQHKPRFMLRFRIAAIKRRKRILDLTDCPETTFSSCPKKNDAFSASGPGYDGGIVSAQVLDGQ